MPVILLETEINAPPEICFDLSRSIDLHEISTAHTKEVAIAGRTKGLMNLDETVTWQAIHFGISLRLTSQITAFVRPYYFKDEQLKGIFKSFIHEHIFEKSGNKVIMKDVFEFHSPFGLLGRIFNRLILTKYLKRFLMKRNQVIKKFAETGKWKEILYAA